MPAVTMLSPAGNEVCDVVASTQDLGDDQVEGRTRTSRTVSGTSTVA
jgi:hypothetical protein